MHTGEEATHEAGKARAKLQRAFTGWLSLQFITGARRVGGLGQLEFQG